LESSVTNLEEERTGLQTAANELAAENAALTSQLQTQQQILVALGRSDTVTVAIGGTESEPDSSGFLIVNVDEQLAFLSTSNLPSSAANQDYQLWLIDGESLISAGVFSVSEVGRQTYTFVLDSAIVNFNAVGISIEPAGGSPQPTGDIVLFGSRDS
jgi:anti-sigma-K factor RskA